MDDIIEILRNAQEKGHNYCICVMPKDSRNMLRMDNLGPVGHGDEAPEEYDLRVARFLESFSRSCRASAALWKP